MAENLGNGVSLVYDTAGYNYDTVVFEKGKPPLDSETNTVQRITEILSQRNNISFPSGWLTAEPVFTNSEANKFYMRDPTDLRPEYALVNGMILKVVNTGDKDSITGANQILLGTPPTTGNVVNGVVLEVWRALLDPNTPNNKPPSKTITDSINGIYMYDKQIGWMVGNNGLILNTLTGDNWNTQVSNVNYDLYGINFTNKYIGWVVGNGGFIARTTSGGSSWVKLTTNISENFKSVFSTSQLKAWVVGTSGVALRTSNGVTWASMATGVTTNLNSVFFKDDQVGWIVGDSGVILKTQDGGTTWFKKNSITSYALNSVYFYDLLNGFAVGRNGTIIKTSDGGESWVDFSGNIYNTQTSTYSKVTNSLNSISIVDSQNAWIAGSTGLILKTTDGGAKWIIQTSTISYDLNSVLFVDKNIGWSAGAFATIINSQDGGISWGKQSSNVITRVVQSVYFEGNISSNPGVSLPDNSIHPQANVETTKRVQIQYRVRILDSIDQESYPDAGLGASGIFGLGPNSNTQDAGGFPFVNMGAITGDYGLWQAKCNNTVDGYVWAIPMFAVNRRNSSFYSPTSNFNGSTIYTSNAIRPDLLLSTDIIDSDILDLRRKIKVPAASELLEKEFDTLSRNEKATKLAKRTSGGDRYGTRLLQVDRIGGTDTDDGGDGLSHTIAEAVTGLVSDEVSVSSTINSVAVPTASSIPSQILATVPSSSNYLFSQNPVYYTATYDDVSPTDPFIGQIIPGYFEGIGTKTVVFHVGYGAHHGDEDPAAGGLLYKIVAGYVDYSSKGLSQIPYEAELVKNYLSGSRTITSIYYRGIRNDVSEKIVDTWPSGVSGYTNYAKIYSGKDASDAGQALRPSTVEIHYFILSTTTIIPTVVTLPIYIFGGYIIFAVSNVLNAAEQFSYKIDHLSTNITTGHSATTLSITTDNGYPIPQNTVIEIICYALFNGGNTLNVLTTTSSIEESSQSSTQNGNTINFDSKIKKVGLFYRSAIISTTVPSSGPISFTTTYGNILGVSSMITVNSTSQMYCWLTSSNGLSFITVKILNITGIGTGTITVTMDPSDLNYPAIISGSILYIQLLIELNTLEYSDPNGVLLIGYNYIPYQTVENLPRTLSIAPICKADSITISNKGTGGLIDSIPYNNPLEQIPVNDTTILDDRYFYNVEPLRFPGFKVDSGFAQLPSYIPGSLGDSLTLSIPVTDALGRTFYSQCSKDFKFSTEGISVGCPRKVYFPIIARVTRASDQFPLGEFILVIFSRTLTTEKENVTGFITGGNTVAAIYRIANKPLDRI